MYLGGIKIIVPKNTKNVKTFLNLAGVPPLFLKRTKKEQNRTEKNERKRTKSYEF